MVENRKSRVYALVGKNISYSFSRKYFTQKFQKENISAQYVNFDIPRIEKLPELIISEPALCGLNITIPYKEQIIPLLHSLSETARQIGAVNTVKITPDRKLIGCNTDCYGFMQSVMPLLMPNQNKALILGTGGASKAVAFAFEQLGIDFRFVSRAGGENLSYQSLTKNLLQEYLIVVNCTPLGTYPQVEDCPPIPYQFLNENHLLYDLIYNPEETLFLKKGKQQGARTQNGYQMLQLQAEKSWEIWNN